MRADRHIQAYSIKAGIKMFLVWFSSRVGVQDGYGFVCFRKDHGPIPTWSDRYGYGNEDIWGHFT